MRYPQELKTYKVHIETKNEVGDRVTKKHLIEAENEEEALRVVISRFGIGKNPTIHVREKV